MRKTTDELDEIKAQKLELELENQSLAVIGAKREVAHLIDIWNSFEHKFTRDEIEAAQPNYWEARLLNNARAMIMSGSGVNSAHIEAMDQAGILENFIQERIEEDRELRNLES